MAGIASLRELAFMRIGVARGTCCKGYACVARSIVCVQGMALRAGRVRVRSGEWEARFRVVKSTLVDPGALPIGC